MKSGLSVGLGLGLGLSISGTLTDVGALSPIKNALNSDAADINVVVCGDSTSSATNEFIYLWFDWLSDQYPSYSFDYYPSGASGGYGSVVSVSTGSGSNTFRLYNNSVSGRSPRDFMGDWFAPAFETPARAWDAVIWNHGKNTTSLVDRELVQGELMAAIAQMQIAFTSTPHIVIDQYPNRDDTDMDIVSTSWQDIVASEPKISLIDFKTGISYVSGDYDNNLHLTAAANTAKLLPYLQSYWNNTQAGAWTAPTPWLTVDVDNLLDGNSGEDYANFTLDGNGTNPGAAAVTPAGFTIKGLITFTQETTIVYDGATRSQEMIATGSENARITRNLTSTQRALAAGENVVLTVIEYVEAGADNTVGRIGINYNGTGGDAHTSQSSGDAQGAWRVNCIGPVAIPSDTTNVQAYLWGDTDATPAGTHKVYRHMAAMAVSSLPRLGIT